MSHHPGVLFSGNVLSGAILRGLEVQTGPDMSAPQYLAVGTVDERSFGQQVRQQCRQVRGQRRDVQDFAHPTRHVHHGLMGEAHIQGSVASL